MEKEHKLQTTSLALHIMAMAFMLCDHLWGTVVAGNDWLTCVGRISFPIFAFMIVEGYFHTKNLKKYVSRLLLFAVISEIPFNIAMGSRIFYPIHQNVLWTFLISILLIFLNEKARKQERLWVKIITPVYTVLLGYILGILTMVDFYHAGILTVLVFYFFRQKKWGSYILQIVCIWYINAEMLGGFSYEITIGDKTFYLMRQAFALLALIPIFLYRGKQGYHSKFIQYTYYAFYPLHLLVLGLVKFFL